MGRSFWQLSRRGQVAPVGVGGTGKPDYGPSLLKPPHGSLARHSGPILSFSPRWASDPHPEPTLPFCAEGTMVSPTSGPSHLLMSAWDPLSISSSFPSPSNFHTLFRTPSTPLGGLPWLSGWAGPHHVHPSLPPPL